MSASHIKTIVQFALPSILGIAVSWGIHDARLDALESELAETRHELSTHVTFEAELDKFNQLILVLNTHLSRL